MLQQVPGAMGRLGVRRPGQVGIADIHQPSFDVDEQCIAVGVKLLTEVGASPR
jgi:amidohydrolase